MDSQNSFPPVQPQQPQPAPAPQPAPSSVPGLTAAGIVPPQNIGYTTPQAPQAAVASHSDLVRTIALIVVSLLSVTFLGLFIWMFVQWDSVKTDVDGQIDAAVAQAEYDVATQKDAEFAEKEKYPYSTFAGPVDYGELTFEYPKTWSVYVERDGNDGNDFQAYFNPSQVNSVNDRTVMALRVSILNQSVDSVMRQYQDFVTEGRLSASSRTINGSAANVFTGTLPNELVGAVAILKIRDKTAVIQTDAEIFLDDYYRLLDTVRFTS